MQLDTEAIYLAKKFCKNMTVWNILMAQMDSEDVDYAAGAEVSNDILIVYFIMDSHANRRQPLFSAKQTINF